MVGSNEAPERLRLRGHRFPFRVDVLGRLLCHSFDLVCVDPLFTVYGVLSVHGNDTGVRSEC